jgi:hypothetical protein
VAEDHGAPGAEEVEVTVAIGVEEIGTLGVGDEGWVAAYGTEGSNGRVDASGKKLFGALLQMAGAIEAAGHASSIGVWLSLFGRMHIAPDLESPEPELPAYKARGRITSRNAKAAD